MDTLSTTWKERPNSQRFLDFTINGGSLASILGSEERYLVGCLGWCRPEADARFRDELLGLSAPDLPNNRVMLYVCPQCADIGCGAITAVVERAGDDLIWSNFAHHNDVSPVTDPDIGYCTEFPNVGPFRFSFKQCSELLGHVAAEP